MHIKYALMLIAGLVLNLSLFASEAPVAVPLSQEHAIARMGLPAKHKVPTTFDCDLPEPLGGIYKVDMASIKLMGNATCSCGRSSEGHARISVSRPDPKHPYLFVQEGHNIHASNLPENWIHFIGCSPHITREFSYAVRAGAQVALASGVLAGAYVYRNEIKAGAKKVANATSNLAKKTYNGANALIKSKL